MKRTGLAIVIGLLLCPLIEASFATASQPFLDAENSIGNAYRAVLDADNAGANVTELVEQLNIAVDLLDEARTVYETNQTYAEELANQTIAIANAVHEAALDLLADTQSLNSVWVILFPLGIVFVIVFVGIVLYYSWRTIAVEEEEELLKMEVSVPEEGDEGEKE